MIRRCCNWWRMRCGVRSPIHAVHSWRFLKFFIWVLMGESKWVLISKLVLRKFISIPITSKVLLIFWNYLIVLFLFWYEWSGMALFKAKRRGSIRVFTWIRLFLILRWCLENKVRIWFLIRILKEFSTYKQGFLFFYNFLLCLKTGRDSNCLETIVLVWWNIRWRNTSFLLNW